MADLSRSETNAVRPAKPRRAGPAATRWRPPDPVWLVPQPPRRADTRTPGTVRAVDGGAGSSGLRRDLELLWGLASDDARSRGGLGVVRLADLVQRDKSQVSRALRALEEVGLVERHP